MDREKYFIKIFYEYIQYSDGMGRELGEYKEGFTYDPDLQRYSIHRSSNTPDRYSFYTSLVSSVRCRNGKESIPPSYSEAISIKDPSE